jgi:signal transduction histidine kinase
MSLKTIVTNPYIDSAGIIAVITALGLAWARYLQPPNIDIVFMLAVLVSALRWGRGVGIFSAIASAVVFDLCFIPPPFSFALTDVSYVVTLTGFVAVAVATSELAVRTRELTSEHHARTLAEARSQAKDEILNHIAHEMRAPLTVLMGRIQMLSERAADPESLSRSVHALQHSGRLLARLIDDLLTASRISTGKLPLQLDPMVLSPVVALVVDAMRVVADEKGITLNAAIEGAIEILGDEQRIMQIVTNLLSNAIKFTPTGGQVSITLIRAGDEAILEVRDTGIGIPEEFLPHVFDQFSQGDAANAREGLGLGLAIVKHLVASHGGTIFVTSGGAGRGTTFSLELPTIAALALTQAPITSSTPRPSRYSAHVH